jgi:hypothetical protein
MSEYERGKKDGLLAFAAFAERVAIEQGQTHAETPIGSRLTLLKQKCWEIAACEAYRMAVEQEDESAAK